MAIYIRYRMLIEIFQKWYQRLTFIPKSLLQSYSPSLPMLQLPPRHSAVWKSRPEQAVLSALLLLVPLLLRLLSIAVSLEPAGDVVESKLTPMHERRRIWMHSVVHVLQSDHADHRPPSDATQTKNKKKIVMPLRWRYFVNKVIVIVLWP